MNQGTLTAPTHSPNGDIIHVPTNSTVEGKGITRTSRGSCSELSSNITWREIKIVVHVVVPAMYAGK